MRGSKSFTMMLPLVTLVAPVAASAQIKADTKEEPAIHEGAKLGMANRFSVTINGVEISSFAEASIDGRAKPPRIVLKRGKDNSMELRAWHEAARTGQVTGARKSASLVVYNYDGKPVARYRLVNAWPSTIETGGQESGAGKVAVETLELAHGGFLETVTIVAEKIERVSP